MIGSWKWNVVISVSGAGLIFFLSIASNPAVTAWYRTGISFAVVFAMTYAVRWMLGEALRAGQTQGGADQDAQAKAEDAEKGRLIDMSTPDDSDDLQAEFLPMQPPRFTTKDGAIDAERLAQAVRHMSEK